MTKISVLSVIPFGVSAIGLSFQIVENTDCEAKLKQLHASQGIEIVQQSAVTMTSDILASDSQEIVRRKKFYESELKQMMREPLVSSPSRHQNEQINQAIFGYTGSSKVEDIVEYTKTLKADSTVKFFASSELL